MASNIVFTAEKTEIGERESFSIKRTGWNTWDASLPWDSLSDCIMTLTNAFSAPQGSVTRGLTYQVRNIAGNYRPQSTLQWLGTDGSEYLLSIHYDELPLLASVLSDLADFEGLPLDLDVSHMTWRNFVENTYKALYSQDPSGPNSIIETAVGVAVESLKGSPEGLAELDSDGKLPESQVPDRLSEAELNATIGGAIGNATTVTPTLDAALASISGSASSLASATVARSNMNPLPFLTSLVTTNPDRETPTGMSNTTVTSVPSPVDPSKSMWKVERTSSGTEVRLTVDHSASPISAPRAAQAVSFWVYIPDASLVTSIQLSLAHAGGTWTRVAGQSGSNGVTPRSGLSLIRFAAHAAISLPTGITSVQVRVLHSAGTPTVLFGPVVLESRKSSLVFINDWGSKPFLDNGYPALASLGVPVTWALRVNRLGANAYPNNHISLAEAKMLAQENGNAISFHSWDGAPTSGMTAEEVRVETLTALAGLHALGLFGAGSTHRAAWVQNMAPNDAAAAPYLAVAPTNTDSTVMTPWPPLDRLHVPRIAIHGKTTVQMDDLFSKMEVTGESILFYTHGVIPGGDANNASQVEWDYFVSKVAAGITAGWLEGRTLADLIERERVDMPATPI